MARILFVVKSLASMHGTERTITDKANYLVEQGHSIAVLTYEQGKNALAFTLNHAIKHIDIDCCFYKLSKQSLLKRFYMQTKVGRLFGSRFKYVVDAFKPDLIVTTTYSKNCMAEIMSIGDVPIVVESHSVLYYEMPANSLLKKMQKRYCMWHIKKCKLLIALTEGDANCWRKYVRHVVVVPNPVTFYCDNVEYWKRLPGRIISVGRLQAPKRFDILIDAFALIADRYPNWYVEIFGDGEYREQLDNKIGNLGLKNRIFLRGAKENIRIEYEKSQFFVQSSDFESFGLVLVEAMACGLPVISTDCPFGPLEIVEDKSTGLLTHATPSDMAEKISWLISHEEERHEFAERAHKYAARFKQDVVMKQWEQIYLQCL